FFLPPNRSSLLASSSSILAANIFPMSSISSQKASSSSSFSSSTPRWKYDVFLSFRGAFAQAFFKHEERFKDDIEKVQTWKVALEEVANLKGWHLQDRSEAQLIQNIVGELWQKLSYEFLEDNEDLVGIESRVKELESCLAIGSDDVRIIGVWGMGGIDINSVLTNNTGTEAIQGIVLNRIEQLWKGAKSFEKLKIIQMNGKLADNQDFIDIFLAVIINHHQGLFRPRRYDYQEYNWRYDMIISGSVIPKWFIHQRLKGYMVTRIVRSTSNVVRRSVISRNLDGIGNWVQILLIRLEKANNCVDKVESCRR
ncbi:hypothetical protein CMV_025986, partial [Castanea mollissima]